MTVALLKLEKEFRDKDATRQPFDPSRATVLPHQRRLLFFLLAKIAGVSGRHRRRHCNYTGG